MNDRIITVSESHDLVTGHRGRRRDVLVTEVEEKAVQVVLTANSDSEENGKDVTRRESQSGDDVRCRTGR